MISVYMEGSGEVIAKLDNLGGLMREELRASIARLSIRLQKNVIAGKLSGQVLGVRTGRLKLHIGKTFPLAQAADAHRYLESRQSTGKLILLP